MWAGAYHAHSSLFTYSCEYDPLKIGNLMRQSFVEGFEVYFFPKLFDKLSVSNK